LPLEIGRRWIERVQAIEERTLRRCEVVADQ